MSLKAIWATIQTGLAGVGAVVLESDSPRVDGIPESLPAIGFLRAGRSGPFRVWILGGRSSGAP